MVHKLINKLTYLSYDGKSQMGNSNVRLAQTVNKNI